MFLDQIDPAKLGSRGAIKRRYSNWLKISHELYGEDITEEKVLCILRLELETLNRPYYVTRIHARFNKLRITRERKELQQWNLKK